MTEHPQDWGLVMPFVLTISHGGPYPDDAFVAGWACGEIDAVLKLSQMFSEITTLERTVATDTLAQLDLCAMRYGFTLTATPTDVDGWALATFTKTDL